MTATFSVVGRTRLSNRWLTVTQASITSYTAAGEAVTANNLGLGVIDEVIGLWVDDGGLVANWDRGSSQIVLNNTNVASTNATVTIGTTTGTVVDDDDAASTGTAVNIVAETDGIFAYLESTTAGNADALYRVGAAGPYLNVNDNDSPGGVGLYFDEDATNDDERFLCVSPTNNDLLLRLSDGSMIRVNDDDNAATAGVQVYFDDDASNDYESFLFVSPTDANGTYETDDAVSFKPGGWTIATDPAQANFADAAATSSATVLVAAIGT